MLKNWEKDSRKIWPNSYRLYHKIIFQPNALSQNKNRRHPYATIPRHMLDFIYFYLSSFRYLHQFLLSVWTRLHASMQWCAYSLENNDIIQRTSHTVRRLIASHIFFGKMSFLRHWIRDWNWSSKWRNLQDNKCRWKKVKRGKNAGHLFIVHMIRYLCIICLKEFRTKNKDS